MEIKTSAAEVANGWQQIADYIKAAEQQFGGVLGERAGEVGIYFLIPEGRLAAAQSEAGWLSRLLGKSKCRNKATASALPSKEALEEMFPRKTPWRVGVREKVFEAAQKASGNGKVYDRYTGKEIQFNDPWEFSHEPQYRFSDWQKRAWQENWWRGDWNNFLNDPDVYRPETRFTNGGHYAEDPYQ